MPLGIHIFCMRCLCGSTIFSCVGRDWDIDIELCDNCSQKEKFDGEYSLLHFFSAYKFNHMKDLCRLKISWTKSFNNKINFIDPGVGGFH